MTTTVKVKGDNFIIACEYFDNQRAKDIPDRKWHPALKVWIAPISKTNAIYINNSYKPNEIDTGVIDAIDQSINAAPEESVPFPVDYDFLTEPMKHQSTALALAWPHNEYALFMDMGTGKTWTAINLAGARWFESKINAMVVVCPTSVKPVWLDELELHCGVDYRAHVHEAGLDRQTVNFMTTPTPDLKILIIGVESLSQGKGWQHLVDFCDYHQTMMVIDESSTIKTSPKYKGGKVVPSRTSRCWDAGEMCKFRLIMTGTPVTQGIQDLFAQFRFLNWEIIGNKNYFSFKSRYTISGGFQKKKIIGYQNTSELMSRVKPYVYSIKIRDVMDMPEQLYEQRYVEMNPIQKRLLADLGDPYDMSTSLDGDELDCETVLERMCRYQQIVGGHFPFALADEKGYDVKLIPGKIPKMEELMSILESLDHDRKVCIWARFYPEQRMIAAALDEMGHNPVWFKGGLTTDERRYEVNRFRTDPTCRFFVSGAAGYRGLTLVESNLNIYYSNTFSYDDREQSERRTWRKGQLHPTLYVDLTANHKIDKAILTALKMKEDLAKFVDRELKS